VIFPRFVQPYYYLIPPFSIVLICIYPLLYGIYWSIPENGEMSSDWQIFFAPMPIILLAQMLFSRWSWEKLRSLERQKWLKGTGIFLTATFITTHLIYA